MKPQLASTRVQCHVHVVARAITVYEVSYYTAEATDTDNMLAAYRPTPINGQRVGVPDGRIQSACSGSGHCALQAEIRQP